MKSLVDGIMAELEKDPRIAAAYDLWYQEREEVLRTYKDDLPPRGPLATQKEFKRIKNIVIQEAVRLGHIPPPNITAQPEPADEPADTGEGSPHAQWTSRYCSARQLLQGDVEQDYAAARELYAKAAAFPYAAFELGKLYREGLGCEADEERAARYFRQAFTGFQIMAGRSPDDRLQY